MVRNRGCCSKDLNTVIQYAMCAFSKNWCETVNLLRSNNPLDFASRKRAEGWIRSHYEALGNDQIRVLIDSGFCFDASTHRWLSQYLKLEEWLEQHGNKMPVGKQSYLSTWVATQKAFRLRDKLSLERIRLLNRLNFPWTSQREILEQQWHEKFDQFKKWHHRHGNAIPPIQAPVLGLWILQQRRKRCKGKLSQEKIRLLDALNFVWDYRQEVLERRWHENLNAIQTFQRKHGHCRIGRENPKLGAFLERLRADFHKLSLARKRAIRAIGIPLHPKDESRAFRIHQIKEFYHKHGHMKITKNHNASLSAWIFHIKKYQRLGILDPKIKSALDKLDFEWESGLKTQWQKRLSQFKAYLSSGGRIPIPHKAKEFRALAHWISNVKGGVIVLTPERRRQLDKIGFPWKCDGREVQWQERVRQFKKYLALGGRVPVPYKFRTLARWITSVRTGVIHLTPKRRRQLDEMGFPWKGETPDSRWQKNVQQFKEYLASGGVIPITGKSKQIRPLVRWIINVRTGVIRLTPERRDQLYEIGFPWKSSRNCSRPSTY